jgi:Rrf2 family nitric oxide-sensitive transcriptional repressor
MHLTKYTDYSLRILMYLAASPDSGCTVAELASTYQVSRNHMVKVTHGLSRLGYIKSTKGKGGGIRLNCYPEEVPLGTLLRQLECNFNLVECFSPATNTCPINSACDLKHILHEALDAFFTTLDTYTLASTVKNRKKLMQTLKIIS